MGKQIQFKDNTNDKVYPNPYWPIGSIFLTVSDTNPSVWFGGTWEKMSGGFLYGAVNSPGNSTGNGTSTSSYTSATGSTKLTAAQSGVPAHTHTTNSTGGHTHSLWNQNSNSPYSANVIPSGKGWSGNITTGGAGDHSHSVNANSAAGASEGHTHSMTHNHSISYLAVWCWKRTA